MSEAAVLTRIEGPLARIVLNRPERRNGVTLAMCAAMHEAVLAVSRSDARVAIVSGAGEHFCVGADLAAGAEAEAPAQPPGSADPYAIYHAATLLHAMPQITIAAIDGGCAGAGMGWAMACDLRYASTRARFSTAFLNVGVSGDMGLGWSLNQLAGASRARELMLFPDRFGADKALTWGLLNDVFEPDCLHAAVLERAEQLAARDPLALRLIKANFLSAETLPLEDYIAIESERHLRTTDRPERARLMSRGYARRT